jgi:CheY-like chemotaxis protein/anti-sigma regulatory factor (Ser/Thr protein kinase)
VVGNLSLARMNPDLPEKTKCRLEQAERASLRAREISRQLLTFAKGGAPIRTTMQIEESLRATVSQSLHEYDVRIEFELASGLSAVDVDVGQVNLALRNLVTHAAHSTQQGGTIEVSAANAEISRGMVSGLKPGRYVRISIRDYGKGIPAQQLARIFEPYFITRRTGSGLGLATAHSIVRRHEGTITVESIMDSGTTFHVFLPASAAAKASIQRVVEQRVHRGQGRILVMDDEADVRLVASDMLELMGYDVDTSPDGAHALQLYTTAKRIGRPYSLVIFDLTIPAGMGGREAIGKLREIDPGAKAIVSSGYSYDPVMANFQEFGFDGVVPKPYKPDELARTLNSLLSAKQQKDMEAY